MILLSLGLLGIGIVDLVRWSPGAVAPRRALLAIVAGTGAVVVLAALSGLCLRQILLVGGGAILVFGLWVAFDYSPFEGSPGWPLAWVGGVFALLFALSGSIGSIGGSLQRWYANLGFGFREDVPVDQFILALGVVVFLTASANRVVRYVLDAAVKKWERSEGVLAGGRILGPLERLIVAAIVLAGDPAAAAIVVTGKGLLRFPEIRADKDREPTRVGPGPDLVTEYFLIGTFTSLVVAVALAVVVLAAS